MGSSPRTPCGACRAHSLPRLGFDSCGAGTRSSSATRSACWKSSPAMPLTGAARGRNDCLRALLGCCGTRRVGASSPHSTRDGGGQRHCGAPAPTLALCDWDRPQERSGRCCVTLGSLLIKLRAADRRGTLRRRLWCSPDGTVTVGLSGSALKPRMHGTRCSEPPLAKALRCRRFPASGARTIRLPSSVESVLEASPWTRSCE